MIAFCIIRIHLSNHCCVPQSVLGVMRVMKSNALLFSLLTDKSSVLMLGEICTDYRSVVCERCYCSSGLNVNVH